LPAAVRRPTGQLRTDAGNNNPFLFFRLTCNMEVDPNVMRDTIPMEDPLTAKWCLKISFDDYKKLLKGCRARDMDDKWAMYPMINDQGNAVIQICRSWLGHQVYVFTVKPGDLNNTAVKDWATIVEISWERKFAGMKIDEKEAKRIAVGFSVNRLNCDFENASKPAVRSRPR
jgi:hypothetical protein